MAGMTATAETNEVLGHGSWQFESKSGGAGHEVRVKAAVDGSMYLTCTCPGGRFAWANKKAPGRGCWAMVAVRKALGL